MYLDNHHEDGRLALWCAAGWIGVRLDRDLSWDEIEDVIRNAHQVIVDKILRRCAANAQQGRAMTK